MAKSDDLFMRMCNEAMDELAAGDKGWKSADTNTLFLACFGMLINHMASKIVKPLWMFAFSLSAGVIGYVAVEVISHIGS